MSAYLRGTSHAVVTDIDTAFRTEFHVNSRPTAGSRRIDDWSVVVMNADGSPGVDAAVSAGAELPFPAPLGWSMLGGGLVLLLASAGLVVLGVRGGASPRAEAAPAA
ncbi:MAG TPA: hypothetical protein VNT03_00265 [Baekduia sp.]|nr:hypothetical protein [Baekduia sp.]